MVDHVRTLLINRAGVPGYVRASDPVVDSVLALFGIGEGDADAVDRVLPLAMAPDLRRFRRFFDQRVTPAAHGSVYGRSPDALSLDGLRGRVLSGEGWWSVLGLFHSDDPGVAGVLAEMREAAVSPDAPYALGAVLLACAYRRWLLGGEVR